MTYCIYYYAQASKSAHDAVVLDMGNSKRLRLRVADHNAFHDPALEPFIGKTVSIKGALLSNAPVLFIDRIEDITVSAKPAARAPKPPRR